MENKKTIDEVRSNQKKSSHARMCYLEKEVSILYAMFNTMKAKAEKQERRIAAIYESIEKKGM